MKRKQHSQKLFKSYDGFKRINCAEAISRAYHKDIAPLSESDLKDFKKCGYGKAPGKKCGAYYAAEYLLERGKPDMLGDFQEYFKQEAGSLICPEIKKGKALPCEECVATVARYLSRNF
jgi:hypothetical protein